MKIQIIKEIENSGLKVMHIIHRWGIENEDTAFEVEAALIHTYLNLTNIMDGNYSKRGVCNAFELEKIKSIKVYEDNKDKPPYIIIKTSMSRVDYVEGNTREERIYNATRSSWRVSYDNVTKYEYVLSVIDWIVNEVYKVEKWTLLESGRCEFIGIIAPENVRRLFVNHKIPAKYRSKGTSNPVLYTKKI